MGSHRSLVSSSVVFSMRLVMRRDGRRDRSVPDAFDDLVRIAFAFVIVFR